MVDSWYEKLREDGDDGVLAHMNQILASMGYEVAKAHHSDAQSRSEDGHWRKTIWRKAHAQPRFGGQFFK